MVDQPSAGTGSPGGGGRMEWLALVFLALIKYPALLEARRRRVPVR